VAISWPGHITDLGGLRNQFHQIIDIVPPWEVIGPVNQDPLLGFHPI
jgi:hypothetical protein